MSASLTYAVSENVITSTFNRISRELGIEKMISPTNDELVQGGYVSQSGRNVQVEQAAHVPEDVIPRSERKPHEMYRQFMNRVKTCTATDFTNAYWKVVLDLERMARLENPSFESPLAKAKLSSWEEYAYSMCPTRPDDDSIFPVLQNWYVGLRLLVQTWEEEQHLVLLWLHMNDAFRCSSHFHSAREQFQYLKNQAMNPTDFLKMDRLRFHLKQKREIKGDAFRCLIFAQQRITTVILSHFINADPELKELGLVAEYVTARNTNIAPGISVSKHAAKTAIEKFRSGEANIICATSVLEEGFDVPAANVVISYDHIKDSVELCQRSGRARHEESSIVILDERPDRPLEMLESVQALQDRMAQSYTPTSPNSDRSTVEEQDKQRHRERQANQSVLQNTAKRNAAPVAALKEYVKKTKAVLQESCNARPPFVYTMSYSSILRSIPAVTYEAPSKKEAKRMCAIGMLDALDEAMR